jgi:tetratricopeptide (TPR) repeat protein
MSWNRDFSLIENLLLSSCKIGFLSFFKIGIAIEAYEKALEIKPDYYEAYYGIGVAYASSNKFKEAIEAYEEAIGLISMAFL